MGLILLSLDVHYSSGCQKCRRIRLPGAAKARTLMYKTLHLVVAWGLQQSLSTAQLRQPHVTGGLTWDQSLAGGQRPHNARDVLRVRFHV